MKVVFAALVLSLTLFASSASADSHGCVIVGDDVVCHFDGTKPIPGDPPVDRPPDERPPIRYLVLGVDATVTRVTNNGAVTASLADGSTLQIAGATQVQALNRTGQFGWNGTAGITIDGGVLTTA